LFITKTPTYYQDLNPDLWFRSLALGPLDHPAVEYFSKENFYFIIGAFIAVLFIIQEEVQKLAAQIEFMKIVQMEMHNRHLRPRPGGYFTTNAAPQSPMHTKTVNISHVS
jgi:hypothetical protein